MRRRARRVSRRFRRTLKSREARLGISLGIVISILVIGSFILLSALVIDVDNKIVITSPKEHHALEAPTVPINSAAKPFGMALSATLDGLSQSELNSELSDLDAMGIRWIRIDIAWAGVQPTSSTQYNWSTTDRIMAAAYAHHLRVLATLAYTPTWAAVSGCNDATQKCAPANDSQFAAYATAVAQRYGNSVTAWEIWNEPNNIGFWMPSPDPSAYTKLLIASYTALKKVDPSVPVLSGSLGPLDNQSGSIQPITFLSGMYAAGARNYFDLVGYHPYSYPALPSTVATWSGWSMMNDLPTSIRSIMTANGDGGKHIWITEYGAPTSGLGTVSAQVQAQMLTGSISFYERYDWLTNYFWYSYKDLAADRGNPGDYFGLLTYNGSQKPAFTAYKQAIAQDK